MKTEYYLVILYLLGLGASILCMRDASRISRLEEEVFKCPCVKCPCDDAWVFPEDAPR